MKKLVYRTDLIPPNTTVIIKPEPGVKLVYHSMWSDNLQKRPLWLPVSAIKVWYNMNIYPPLRSHIIVYRRDGTYRTMVQMGFQNVWNFLKKNKCTRWAFI